jgi:hypothetical protein
MVLTIDPGDDNTFSQRQEHERENGTIPVHDLKNVDTTLWTYDNNYNKR